MNTVTSKLTSKGQATIPAAVRKQLGLKPGDAVAFDIDAGVVKLRKAEALDWEYLRLVETTLTEWNSPEDDEAFNDLQAI